MDSDDFRFHLFNGGDATVSMKKIDWGNYKEVYPYFWNRKEILRITSLPTFLVDSKHLFEIVDEVLFIYKTGNMYGRKYQFMPFPPFTLHNNTQLERCLLEEKLIQLSVILSEEEVSKYNLLKDCYNILKGSYEFLYPLDNYADLTGKKWHKWRIAAKSLERDFKVEVIHSRDIRGDYFFRWATRQYQYCEIKKLITKWLEVNKSYQVVYSYLNHFFELKLDDALLTYLIDRKTNKIVFYVITQRLSRNTVFIADWKSLNPDVSYNLNKGVLLKLVDYWKHTGITHFNIGRTRGKGMADAKRILRPEMMKTYKVRAK